MRDVCVVVVVVVEIIKLYLIQTGRFLAATGYVAPSLNHVQNNVPEIRMYLNISLLQRKGRMCDCLITALHTHTKIGSGR